MWESDENPQLIMVRWYYQRLFELEKMTGQDVLPGHFKVANLFELKCIRVSGNSADENVSINDLVIPSFNAVDGSARLVQQEAGIVFDFIKADSQIVLVTDFLVAGNIDRFPCIRYSSKRLIFPDNHSNLSYR